MKYLLLSEKIQEKITLNYVGGFLKTIDFPQGLTEVQYNWFLKNVPHHEAHVAVFARSGNFQVYAVGVYTFEDFWEFYGYKVGKKERAKKLWESLTEVEQDRCMASIVMYKRYLAQNPNIAQCYPETYLSQKRWENEYR